MKTLINPSKFRVLVFAGIFVLIGVTFLLMTRAATPSHSVEAESGQRTANTSLVSDATASNGSAIMFNQPTQTITFKPQLAGVSDRHNPPTAAYSSVVNAFTAELNWSDLEPTRGNYNFSKLDSDITYAKQNAAKGVRLRVRILAGVKSPDWLKNLDGTPLVICDPNGDPSKPEDPNAPPNCQTATKFWTPNFKTAYQQLLDKIATRYDAQAEVAEITMFRCMTVYAEPMQRQVSYKNNYTTLTAAGWTADKDKQCMNEMIDAHKVFKQIRSSFAFNPFQYLYDAGGGNIQSKTDMPFTLATVDYCRNALAKACVLGNNSIRDYVQSGNYETLYAKMRDMGPPIYYQTAGTTRVGDLGAAINRAISYGAGNVELPGDYETMMTAAQLQPFDSTLTSKAIN